MNGLVSVKICFKIARSQASSQPNNAADECRTIKEQQWSSEHSIREHRSTYTDTAACFAARSSAVTKYNAVQKLYRHPVDTFLNRAWDLKTTTKN